MIAEIAMGHRDPPDGMFRLVVVGGVIPHQDYEFLQQNGTGRHSSPLHGRSLAVQWLCPSGSRCVILAHIWSMRPEQQALLLRPRAVGMQQQALLLRPRVMGMQQHGLLLGPRVLLLRPRALLLRPRSVWMRQQAMGIQQHGVLLRPHRPNS